MQAKLESDKKNFIASKLLGPQAVARHSSVVKVADMARPIVKSTPKKSGGNMAPLQRKPQAKEKAKSRKCIKLQNEKPTWPSPLLKFGFKKK